MELSEFETELLQSCKKTAHEISKRCSSLDEAITVYAAWNTSKELGTQNVLTVFFIGTAWLERNGEQK